MSNLILGKFVLENLYYSTFPPCVIGNPSQLQPSLQVDGHPFPSQSSSLRVVSGDPSEVTSFLPRSKNPPPSPPFVKGGMRKRLTCLERLASHFSRCTLFRYV